MFGACCGTEGCKCGTLGGVVLFLVGLVYILKELGKINFNISIIPVLVLVAGLLWIYCGFCCKK